MSTVRTSEFLNLITSVFWAIAFSGNKMTVASNTLKSAVLVVRRLLQRQERGISGSRVALADNY